MLTSAPFHPNRGQYFADARFGGRAGNVDVAVGDGILSIFPAPSQGTNASVPPVEIQWIGISGDLKVEGESPAESTVSYFLGEESTRWAADLPSFRRVRMRSLYPGIDVVVYVRDGLLEFDYHVQPGADPAQIRWKIRDAAGPVADSGGFRLGDDGSLRSATEAAAWSLKPPVAYQNGGSGPRMVGVRFVAVEDSNWGLAVEPYDRSTALIIDPVLSYSSYHGGTLFDQANAVATDASKNIFIAGETWSTNLTAVNATQSYRKSGKDAFLVKFAPDGKTILTATYFGGNGDDIATGLAVSGTTVLVAGETNSGDLAGSSGRYQSVNRGGKDGVITRIQLGTTTEILGTTYLGGASSDRVSAMVLDLAGNVYVAGLTTSSNFPVSGSFGLTIPGGTSDAFVAKLSQDLGTLLWSGVYGGNGSDQADGLALGSGNTVWFTGSSSSTNLPSVNAVQSTLSGSYDCFVARVSDNGANLLHSSYIGGSGSENCYAIAVDAAGDAIVAGSSSSLNFPVTPGAYQPVRSGSYDNVMVKISASTGALAFATYLGGMNTEAPTSLYVDTDGAYCMAGYTLSSNYPTVFPVQPTLGGSVDGFLSCLSDTGSALLFSTYLGGADEDRILAAARRSDVWTVVVGLTQSTNFPMAGGARQPVPVGSGDAFVTAISRTGTNVYPANVSVTPSNGSTETADLTYVVEDGNGFQDIKSFYALIHNAVSTVGGCYTLYNPDLNQISLLSDDGRYWVGNAKMGEKATLTNSQCSIDVSKSSAWGFATRMTIRLFYSFRPGFGGIKSLLMYTQDRANVVAGWQLKGGWNVPQLAGNVQPSVDYFQPNSGTFQNTAFVFRVVDGNGANDIRDVYLIANDTLTNPNSCYLHYNPSSNQIRLLNDAATQYLGPVTPGVSGTLENSSCILGTGYTSATKSGDTLTMSIYLSFKAAAAGANTVWTQVSDQSNTYLGWRNQGTFTVPIGPAFSRPVAQSIAVATVGTRLRFTLTGTDENGGNDLKDFYFLANGTLTNPNGCYVQVKRIANQVLLLNDTGSAWQGSGTVGTSQIIENSQCRIDLSTVSTSVAVNSAQVVMDVQFKAGFTGQKSAWLYVEDNSRLSSGWVFLNSFTPIPP